MRRSGAGFFHWEQPGEPVQVLFHLNAVELLDRDAIRAGKNVTAGILLGKREDGPVPTFVVENYEPIPTATWRTTDSAFGDRRQLKAMIERWTSRQHRRVDVLGFHRSCLADETGLSADDLLVAQEITGQPEALFLLIQPRSGQPSNGRLFLTKEGAVSWEWPATAFNRAELSGRGAPRRPEIRPAAMKKELPPALKRPPQIAEEPRAQEFLEENAAAENEPWNDPWKKIKWQWIGGALALIALLTIGTVLIRNRAVKTPPEPKADAAVDPNLGLKFDRVGTDIQLSWNAQAAAILSATSGQLIITDGPISKTVDLDSSDLKRGSLTYSPLTNDLVFKLKVNVLGAADPIAESVRIVSGLPTPAGDPAAQALSASSNGMDPVRNPAVANGTVQSMEQPYQIFARTSQPTSASAPVGDLQKLNSGIGRPAASNRIELPEERIVTRSSVREPSNATTNARANRATATRKDSGPASVVSSKSTVNAALNTPVTFAKPVETIPVIRTNPTETAPTDAFAKSTRRGGTVQPAQLISNSNPQYPPEAKDEGISGAVELHFKIASNGEVREINVVKGPRILAEAAVDAVRARRYKPARVDGVPTETDASATFDFKLN
jgi:TonB family protein